MFKYIYSAFLLVGCFLLSSSGAYAIENNPIGKDAISRPIQKIQTKKNEVNTNKFLDEKRTVSKSFQKELVISPAELTKQLYGEEPNPFLTAKLSTEETPAVHYASGDGNNMPWTYFYYGDIVVMRNDGCSYSGYPCYWSHSAMFDTDWDTGSESAFAFWSAYPNGAAPSDNSSSPYSVNGVVGLQSKASVHAYSSAQALWAPSTTAAQQIDTTWYAYYQRGEPYSTIAKKTKAKKWYCSKIPYRAYLKKTGLNLDYDGGYYVFPDDIYNDGDVSVFAVGY